MLKGTPLSKRDNAWHTRNTKRTAQRKRSHAMRVIRHANGGGVKDKTEIARAEEAYRAAQKREGDVRVGRWGRVRLFISQFFKRYATRH